MSNFKQKPNKFKYLTVNETLDDSYKKQKKHFKEQEDELKNNEIELENLKKELEKLDNLPFFNNYIDIRTNIINNIERLEEKNNDIVKDDEKINYYSQVHEELFTYYNTTDKIDSNNDYSSDMMENEKEMKNQIKFLKSFENSQL